MYCLKCGKETQEEKIFCEACLQSMEQYPVKPGTAVHLPRQDAPTASKKPTSTKKAVSAEDQVVYLKKLVRWMALLLLAAVVALGAALLQLLHIL